MNINPILEEAWRVKDQLAANSGYDVDRFFEQLDVWSAENRPAGELVHSTEQLRQVLEEKQRKRGKESSLILNDKPPRNL